MNAPISICERGWKWLLFLAAILDNQLRSIRTKRVVLFRGTEDDATAVASCYACTDLNTSCKNLATSCAWGFTTAKCHFSPSIALTETGAKNPCPAVDNRNLYQRFGFPQVTT